ncbi:MAG: tRNA (adenosine(37)-N6)-threonylcarbamoyltransferase complex ATPase subunit type 1 TsaE [Gammaproteobacteria bacterium]
MLRHELYLADEHALEALAAQLARAWLASADAGLVVLLHGNLGAGKTTFARGFLHGAGHTGIVKSPTYTLVEPYQLETGRRVYHFDLYRLADAEELEFTGARDYFDADSACLVEWPEKATGYLPQADIECLIEVLKSGRVLSLSSATERGKALMRQALGDDLL